MTQPHSRVRSGRAQRGFTLLELIVVLAIAALAAAAVGGGVQAVLEQARYREAVRDVVTLLGQARAASVRDGVPVAVRYQPGSRQLSAEGRGAVTLPEGLDIVWQAPELRLPPGQEAPLFVFDPDGGALGGALQVSRGAGGVVFRVNWLLGTVEQSSVGAGA